jgi:hypothetical protein
MEEMQGLIAEEIEERRAAPMAAVGLWKDRDDLVDADSYVRTLRNGDGLRRLN